MGFWSNVLMAIVSTINPAIGFLGSIVKYILSPTKGAWPSFVVNIMSQFIPGGLVKNLVAGMVSDVIEMSSLSGAISQITPYNNLVLICDICRRDTHYYVKNDGLIKCRHCLKKNASKRISRKDKIYIFHNSIDRVHEELRHNNSLIVKLRDQPKVYSSKTPSIYAPRQPEIREK